jgi:CPA1 family monovalent cation:H+ antiporter
LHDVVFTVFAVTGLLGLVSLLLPVAQRLRIPYAVLLAAVGCAIGGATAYRYAAGDGVVGDMLRTLGGFNLTADAFLYIFLPALLFETAINVDVRRLYDEIGPILLLAVIGVVISTVAVGAALWLVSGVALIGCLILGAILATTDPIAVVAIFRDIGAPRRLTMLVEGESLFNDAAAIAIFTLLVGMLTGERAPSVVGGILAFLAAFVGGLAFGYLFGRFVCLLLPALRDHPLAETTLTVALAYLSFVVGEHYLGVSGVVATVSAGLALSDQGRRRLSPSSWEAMIRSWEQVAFWASSLIFLFAAMMVPAMLADAGWQAAGYLGIIIAAAAAARAVTLFGLLPLLSAAGLAQRISTAYNLVILWGGMRGAVSLALALAATENLALPAELRQFIATLATGFVLFTLFVTAPTLRPLMRLLGLDRLAPADLALRDRVVALSLSTVRDDLLTFAGEHGINGAVAGEATMRYRRHADAAATVAEENAQIPAERRLRSALAILVEREQEYYLEYFEARTMSRRAVGTRLAHVAALRDAVKTGGLEAYRQAAARNLAFGWFFRFCLWLQRRLYIEWPLARELADRFEVMLAARSILQQLCRFNERQLKELFGAGPSETLDSVLGERLAAVGQAIDALMLQYPTYAQSLQTQFLTLAAIRLEDERYRRLHAESVISLEVYNDLQRSLAQRRRAAERRPRLDLGLRREQLIERLGVFAGLPPDRRAAIARVLRPRLTIPGEVIIRRGDHGEEMYFISSGAVEVIVQPRPVRLGTGDFFGEIALLRRLPRTADVISLGYCQLLSLSRRDLVSLMRGDKDLRDHITATARRRLGSYAAE